MKIIVITGNYPNRKSPYNGIFIHQQVKALREAGVECYVLLLHNWYPPFGWHRYHGYWREGHTARSAFFTEYEGVTILPVPMVVKMPTRLFNESYYDRAAGAIVRFIKGHKELQGADWLYAHFLTDNGFIAAKVKDRLNIKLAAIARGDDIHAWPEANAALRPNLAYVFERADLLLANSRNLGNDAHKWMLAGKSREVDTVYNGIDYRQYRPVASRQERDEGRVKFGLDRDTKYMICVATPVALKGWNELLEAVAGCGPAFDGWQLLIVAPERSSSDTIDLAGRAAGMPARARFMGQLSPADLAILFRVCDMFVLPSYNEGMANALLEAMASALPCIATEVGGHNEVIENGVDGLLIAPKSVRAIQQAFETLLSDDRLRAAMGSRARARMIAFGDYRENAGRLLQLLRSHT